MCMDETRYHTIADATLMHCFDQLEDAFEAGTLDDMEHASGVLTLVTETGKTFVISKQTPLRELWVASPISGGLHFFYDDGAQRWESSRGLLLYDLLRSELASEGIAVVL
jgi:iron donor protein CyaY